MKFYIFLNALQKVAGYAKQAQKKIVFAAKTPYDGG
jgi:hypothetical protein